MIDHTPIWPLDLQKVVLPHLAPSANLDLLSSWLSGGVISEAIVDSSHHLLPIAVKFEALHLRNIISDELIDSAMLCIKAIFIQDWCALIKSSDSDRTYSVNMALLS